MILSHFFWCDIDKLLSSRLRTIFSKTMWFWRLDCRQESTFFPNRLRPARYTLPRAMVNHHSWLLPTPPAPSVRSQRTGLDVSWEPHPQQRGPLRSFVDRCLCKYFFFGGTWFLLINYHDTNNPPPFLSHLQSAFDLIVRALRNVVGRLW